MTRLVLNVARPWEQPDAVPLTERALRCGFDGVGLVDSPRLFPDVWLGAARVLGSTRAGLAGPVVASLGLRHPAAVAASLRTLEHQHPGRVLTVVGRGESSLRNEGLPVPRLAAYAEAMALLNELVGDTAPGRVLGAASGPRTVTASARALGGVLLDVGTDPGTVRRAATLAREHGADTVWVFLRTVVTASDDAARDAFAPLLGSCAMRAAAAPEWYGLPPGEVSAVRELAGTHDYTRHGSEQISSSGRAAELVRHRFALTGDATEISARLAALAPPGLDGVVVAGGLPGVTEALEPLGAALRRGLEQQ